MSTENILTPAQQDMIDALEKLAQVPEVLINLAKVCRDNGDQTMFMKFFELAKMANEANASVSRAFDGFITEVMAKS